MQDWTVDELKRRGLQFTELRGSVQERAAAVETIIGPPHASEN